MIALIDGDILVYQCAAHKTVWKVGMSFFVTKAKALKNCPGSSPTKRRYTPNLADIKQKIDRIINRIKSDTLSNSFKIFLTEEGEKYNFRKEITRKSTYLPMYKENRKGLEKPFYYKETRAYLIQRYTASVAIGREADDNMAIEYLRLTKKGLQAVLCTVDKDLKTVPGAHYNTTTREFANISFLEAKRFLYSQMLIGDRVDNIIGIKGVGPVKARKALHGAKTELEMYNIVAKAYKKEHGDDSYKEILHETANLVYIQWEEDVRWKPPFTRDKKREE